MTTHELKKWTSKIKEYKIRKNYSCASFRLPWNECLDVIGRDVVIQYDYYDSNGVFFSSFTIDG